MLKASSPVVVLFTSWLWGIADPTVGNIVNILFIVLGVGLAGFGEIDFSWVGVVFQLAGLVFEAIRVVMIQVMLSGEGMNMDPLVGLYYYAPVCAAINFVVAVAIEMPHFSWDNVVQAGPFMLLLNATVAFLLSFTSMVLVSDLNPQALLRQRMTTHILTENADWQDFGPGHHPDRHLQEHPPYRLLRHHLENRNLPDPSRWLQHQSRRPHLLRLWTREAPLRIARLHRVGGQPLHLVGEEPHLIQGARRSLHLRPRHPQRLHTCWIPEEYWNRYKAIFLVKCYEMNKNSREREWNIWSTGFCTKVFKIDGAWRGI